MTHSNELLTLLNVHLGKMIATLDKSEILNTYESAKLIDMDNCEEDTLEQYDRLVAKANDVLVA